MHKAHLHFRARSLLKRKYVLACAWFWYSGNVNITCGPSVIRQTATYQRLTFTTSCEWRTSNANLLRRKDAMRRQGNEMRFRSCLFLAGFILLLYSVFCGWERNEGGQKLMMMCWWLPTMMRRWCGHLQMNCGRSFGESWIVQSRTRGRDGKLQTVASAFWRRPVSTTTNAHLWRVSCDATMGQDCGGTRRRSVPTLCWGAAAAPAKRRRIEGGSRLPFLHLPRLPVRLSCLWRFTAGA